MSSIAVHEVADAASGPYSVACTADGAVWVSLVHGGAVVRLAPSTREAERLYLGEGAQPSQVAAAGDDSVWITDTARDQVLLVGPSGVIRSFAAASAGAQPFGIAAVHDGSAWFTGMGNDSLGRVGILGEVTEFASGTRDGLVSMIAASGDSLWFTANRANAVGYVRGGDSAPVIVALPTPDAGPVGITVGDDGAAWFCEILAGAIGRVDRRGSVSEFALPDRSAKPHAIVADPAGGGCWFTLWGSDQLGRIGLDGVFADPIVDLAPSGHAEPHGLAVDRDGTVWVAMESGAVLAVSR
ncbi:MAG: virginiamycin B lyase [Herbiconiux sp.]|uniref:Vgb family protein n=1 Tax=Herbiconiux sp. TaxID=1871186 RepID=UPI00120CFB46|nr:virginiamycin B lyase [Herbiconiux sp.]TAJ48557.1 MAG: virginiamycin B lyase [Herbiconiux sp.]